MENTALLFAGQGAQFVGMGRDLTEAHPTAEALVGHADQALGYNLSKICFNGPEKELVRTENAQPGIHLVGWIAFQLLKEFAPDLSFGAAAGLSLGEFTALAAADAISFEDSLKVVRRRGQLMQHACEATSGGMAAIIGLDEQRARDVCGKTNVQIANLNCPGQIVVSGGKDCIEDACEAARESGAKRAIPLNVTGAYHSPLMAPAQPGLSEALSGIRIHRPGAQVISNVTAESHGSPEDIARLLVDQVTSPVLWERCIRRLIADGFTRFIELGPGTTLTSFMRRIDRSMEVHNISDTASLAKTLEMLKA